MSWNWENKEREGEREMQKQLFMCLKPEKFDVFLWDDDVELSPVSTQPSDTRSFSLPLSLPFFFFLSSLFPFFSVTKEDQASNKLTLTALISLLILTNFLLFLSRSLPPIFVLFLLSPFYSSSLFFSLFLPFCCWISLALIVCDKPPKIATVMCDTSSVR